MSILSRYQQPQVPAVPVLDVGGMMSTPPPGASGYETMDPLAAAQIYSRLEDNSSVGIANITVDNRRIIEEFRERLRGYRIKKKINYETGEIIGVENEKFGEPMMSEDGINHLCGLLESALSKNIMLSNIPLSDKRSIIKMTQVFYRTIALQIAVNSEKWCVDRSRRDSIPLEISILFYSNLMRAFDDGERRKLYPTQKNLTSMNINPAQLQQQNKPLISFA